MLFKVLGPLEVELAPGDVVAPGGARARALLAALLVQPGAVVPVHRLAEAVWGEAQPESVETRCMWRWRGCGARWARPAPAWSPARPATCSTCAGHGWTRTCSSSGAAPHGRGWTPIPPRPPGSWTTRSRSGAARRSGTWPTGSLSPAAVRLEELRRGAAEDRAEVAAAGGGGRAGAGRGGRPCRGAPAGRAAGRGAGAGTGRDRPDR